MDTLANELYKGNNSVEIQQKASSAILSFEGFQWACDIVSKMVYSQPHSLLFALQIIKRWVYFVDSNDNKLDYLMGLLTKSLNNSFEMKQHLFCVKIGETLNILICKKIKQNEFILRCYINIIIEKTGQLILLLLKLLLEDLDSTKIKQKIQTKQLLIVKTILANESNDIVRFLFHMTNIDLSNTIIALGKMVKYMNIQCINQTNLIPFLNQLIVNTGEKQDDVFDCVNELMNKNNMTIEGIQLLLPLVQTILKIGNDKVLLIISSFINSYGDVLHEQLILQILVLVMEYFEKNINKIDIIHRGIELLNSIFNTNNGMSSIKMGNNSQLLEKIVQMTIYSSFHFFNHRMNCIDVSKNHLNDSQYKSLMNQNFNLLETIFILNRSIVINLVNNFIKQIANSIFSNISTQLSEMELLDLTTFCYYFIFTQPKVIEKYIPFDTLISLYQPFFIVTEYLQKENDSIIIKELLEQLLVIHDSFYLLLATNKSNDVLKWCHGFLVNLLTSVSNCACLEVASFYIKTSFLLIEEGGEYFWNIPIVLSLFQQPLKFISNYSGPIQTTFIVSFLNTLITFMRTTPNQLEVISSTFQNVFQNTCIYPLMKSIENKDEQSLKIYSQTIINFLKIQEVLSIVQKKQICSQINEILKKTIIQSIPWLSDDNFYFIMQLIFYSFKKLSIEINEEIISVIIKTFMAIFNGRVVEIISSNKQIKTKSLCVFIKLLSSYIIEWNKVHGDDPSQTFVEILNLAFIFCLNDVAKLLTEATVGSEIFREGYNILFDVTEIYHDEIEEYPEFSYIGIELIGNGIQLSDIEMVQLISRKLIRLNKKIHLFTLSLFESRLGNFLSKLLKTLVSSLHSFETLSELLFIIISSSEQNFICFKHVLSDYLIKTLLNPNQKLLIPSLVDYFNFTGKPKCEEFQELLKYFINDVSILIE